MLSWELLGVLLLGLGLRPKDSRGEARCHAEREGVLGLYADRTAFGAAKAWQEKGTPGTARGLRYRHYCCW